MRVWRSGFNARILQNSRGELLIAGDVLIEAPFGNVAVHVIKPPWVRLLAADFLVFEITVCLVPGVFPQLRWIVAEGICGSRACPAGIFPFRFGRQAIELPRLRAEPLAIFGGSMVRHADCWITILSHPETHFHVWLGWPRNSIRKLVHVRLSRNGFFELAFLILKHK